MKTQVIDRHPAAPASEEQSHVLQAWDKIDRLDFLLVAKKLKLPYPEGRSWSDEQIEMAIKWYRRFLKLCVKYPQFRIVPNDPIDAVWHGHLMDTRQYIADCQEIFGEILHHYPYFGMLGDKVEKDNAFINSNDLYLLEFGEDCKVMGPLFMSADEGVMCDGSGSTCSSCRIEGNLLNM